VRSWEPREAFVVAVVAARGEKACPLAAPALGAGGDRGSLVEHVGGERHLARDAGGAQAGGDGVAVENVEHARAGAWLPHGGAVGGMGCLGGIGGGHGVA
jgi:hypothetical protein